MPPHLATGARVVRSSLRDPLDPLVTSLLRCTKEDQASKESRSSQEGKGVSGGQQGGGAVPGQQLGGRDKEAIRRVQKEYREANKEELAARQREKYRSNKEELNWMGR